jgi:hypothetical protein
VQPQIGFPGYRLAPPPADGFWRVTDFHDPFSPKDPPPPIGGVDPAEDDAGRFDDPDGKFRTLYCASEPEGALGEKLAPFALNPNAARRIATFIEGDTDPEFADEGLTASLDSDQIDGFRWLLAWAPPRPAAPFIDLWHWSTCVALVPAVARLLGRYGLRALDRRALADERRGFTRRLAGILRANADSEDGLRAAGIRFDSRLPPAWTCWALWEPLALDAERAQIETVSIDTPQLRRAAEMLGVVLR